MSIRLTGSHRWHTGMLAAVLAATIPLQAHHSFAPFDQTKTMVFTGVVTVVNPDANHLQIYFAPMNAERKNVERDAKGEPSIWEVEMAGSAAAAGEGISVSSFPKGTVFSVAMRPMRNGEHKGLRQGALFKCPGRTPPQPGKHCDSVDGHQSFGDGPLPAPTD
ncbi:MAG: DUF6152 family protein [Pseudomonadota bacterium]|nr:DUF6152 family protein [Pseudomonadota bacterium]